MTIFTDEFVQEITKDPLDGTSRACEAALKMASEKGLAFHKEIFLEIYALFMELQNADLFPITINLVDVASDDPLVVSRMFDQVAVIHTECKKVASKRVAESELLRFGALRAHFRAYLGTGFHYEFSQGDLERVQELINQLRQAICMSAELQTDHQQRLLNRLETLQTELHKKVSDLDRFWGLIGDAGVVLGKLGNDAKPLVDRIREITEIVWRTQSRAEELPSGTHSPLLGKVDGGA